VPAQPTLTLNNGVTVPQLGFGVFKVPPAETTEAVSRALAAGYRHIDTAAMYGNEEGVGRALAESGLPREELFVTTKLNNDAHGADEALRAFEDSRRRLGLDVVDLYLIHWPLPARDRYVETWRSLEKLLRDGVVRAIGVSNFQVAHLERLAQESDTVPAMNQIELHPYLSQARLREYHQAHGIATEAWSPLAKGGALLRDQVITGLAEKYAKTPAQLVLRWHLQLGNVVIPKSVTPSRIEENFAVFDFELDRDDLAEISSLNRDERTGPDPDTFNP
jgi:diketogulonate reductase-like aldo/keto reductase